MQRNLIKFIEQLEKKMNNLKFLLFVVIIFCSFLWTSVDGSMSNSRMTGKSSYVCSRPTVSHVHSNI